MPAALLAETLTPVVETNGEESRGQAIKRRMEALGMGPADLAKEADLSRGAVYRVIADEDGVQNKTYSACERALDRVEYELGHGGPDAVLSTEQGLIEFEVTGDFGVRVVVKGPMENALELEESVARLIRNIRSGDGATD